MQDPTNSRLKVSLSPIGSYRGPSACTGFMTLSLQKDIEQGLLLFGLVPGQRDPDLLAISYFIRHPSLRGRLFMAPIDQAWKEKAAVEFDRVA